MIKFLLIMEMKGKWRGLFFLQFLIINYGIKNTCRRDLRAPTGVFMLFLQIFTREVGFRGERKKASKGEICRFEQSWRS